MTHTQLGRDVRFDPWVDPWVGSELHTCSTFGFSNTSLQVAQLRQCLRHDEDVPQHIWEEAGTQTMLSPDRVT